MERQEEKEGASITVKKKTKGKGGRQAKLTGSITCGWVCSVHYTSMVIFFLVATGKSNSLSVTKPSAFAEVIDPIIPEFCAVKKEKGVKAKKPKIDPGQCKLEFQPSSETGGDKDDPGQCKMEFQPSSETGGNKDDPGQCKMEFQPSSETGGDNDDIVMMDDVLVISPVKKKLVSKQTKKASTTATKKSEDSVATKSINTKRKAPAAKKRPVKRVISDDDNVKHIAKKSPVKHLVTPDISSDDEEEVPKQRSKRQCKRIKYTFSDDEEENEEEEWQQIDDDEDDEDFFEMD